MKKLILFSILSLLTNICFSQDDCKDVLVAAFNETRFQNSQTLSHNFSDYFTSDKFQRDVESMGGSFSVTLPVEGVPVEFGGSANQSNYNELRESITSGRTDVMNSEFVTNFMSKMANDKVITAWSDCINQRYGNSPGLRSSLRSVGGNEFTLSVWFNPIGTIAQCEISTMEIRGCSYNDQIIKPGTIISSQPISLLLTRESNKNIVVILNAKDNNGSTSSYALYEEPVVVSTTPHFQEYVLIYQRGSQYDPISGMRFSFDDLKDSDNKTVVNFIFDDGGRGTWTLRESEYGSPESFSKKFSTKNNKCYMLQMKNLKIATHGEPHELRVSVSEITCR